LSLISVIAVAFVDIDAVFPPTVEVKLVMLVDKAVSAFADIEYNGLDLDIPKWLALGDTSLKEATTLKAELEHIVFTTKKLSRFVPKFKQVDMFQETPTQIDVNWDSPKQVLDVFKTYVPKLDNVNGKELIKYKNKYKIIGQYIKYKEQMKIASSYGEAFLKHVREDNKVHTSFNQILDTGRVSSSRPNMQQIPADNRFRNCFTAPEGWSFVSADYSSQELNVIAFGSKDPVWISALEQGKDLHSVCAELVYGNTWSEAAEEDCQRVMCERQGRPRGGELWEGVLSAVPRWSEELDEYVLPRLLRGGH
jgi:hypothetical protein